VCAISRLWTKMSFGFFNAIKQQFTQSSPDPEPFSSSSSRPSPSSSPSSPSSSSSSSSSSSKQRNKNPSSSSSSPSSSPLSTEKRKNNSSPNQIKYNSEISDYFKHVSITASGPIYLRLRIDEQQDIALVSGFEKSLKKTEIELDGRVKIGDVLVAVNYTPLYLRSFDDILLILKNQPEPSQQFPKILTFCSKILFLELLQTVPLQIPLALSLEKKKQPLTNGSIYHQAIQTFQQTVEGEGLIDEIELRQFSSMGLPDGCHGIRSMIWKILLG
jgi:DNA mismatch repair ATPase MutL